MDRRHGLVILAHSMAAMAPGQLALRREDAIRLIVIVLGAVAVAGLGYYLGRGGSVRSPWSTSGSSNPGDKDSAPTSQEETTGKASSDESHGRRLCLRDSAASWATHLH